MTHITITLDQSAPTEPGWYFYEDDYVRVTRDMEIQYQRGGDRIPIKHCKGRWSRRIEIVGGEA